MMVSMNDGISEIEQFQYFSSTFWLFSIMNVFQKEHIFQIQHGMVFMQISVDT